MKPTYRELEKRVEELKARVRQHQMEQVHHSSEIFPVLLEAFQYIPACKTFTDAAVKIFGNCKSMIGARSGYLALVSENGEENEVLFLDAGGLPCDVDPDLPMPIRGLREVAYRTKEVVHDNAFSESPWMKYMPQGHVRLDNVLFAPISIEGEAVGVIGLANKSGGFCKNDVHMASIFGDLAAVALSYAKTQESVLRKQEQLEAHTRKLEEMNTALNMLIDHRNKEKESFKTMLVKHFEKLVFPYFLKTSDMTKEELSTSLSIIEINIRELLLRGENKHLSVYLGLTPMESQIAQMIRQGKKSKDMADHFKISIHTIYFHRENIRKKLKLTGAKTNLKNYLQSGL